MQLFDTVNAALERAMQGATLRHTALAQNVANVNTPGYIRKDVDFHAALAAAMPGGPDAVQGAAFGIQTDDSAPVRADGNSVDIDTENADLAENALEYEALAQVMTARDSILRSAMGVG